MRSHVPAALLSLAGLWPALAGAVPARLKVEVQSEGRPVTGAAVTTPTHHAQTGDDGIALLSVEPGRHSLVVSAAGYLPVEVQVAVEASAETHLIVELTSEIELEEEIVVRASRTDRRLEDQPVRIEVVNREEIEEKALMTPGSVAMLLNETTGLRVQNTAPSTGASNVRIQGLRGRYSQMLSDGLPLYGVQGNSLNLLQVPPLDLGQVEIIKGAASALYGPSALGGVINLVSQSPRRRHRELLLNASTQDGGDLTFWATEPTGGNWAYTLIGGLHGQLRQDLDEDGRTCQRTAGACSAHVSFGAEPADERSSPRSGSWPKTVGAEPWRGKPPRTGDPSPRESIPAGSTAGWYRGCPWAVPGY
jgi:iron complex outermembrane receptor protein